MSVVRFDIEKCIGCRICYKICPMDVFRISADGKKSVIAFPESCISCGQCFVNCPGHSLALSNTEYGHSITSLRLNPEKGMNNRIYVPVHKAVD